MCKGGLGTSLAARQKALPVSHLQIYYTQATSKKLTHDSHYQRLDIESHKKQQRNIKYPHLRQHSIQPTLGQTSVYSTKNIRQERKEILRCCSKYFSIDSFCAFQITTLQKQEVKTKPVRPCDTAQACLLTWHDNKH